MIHSLHSITVGEFVLFDSTGKYKYLKRWYNFLPALLFKKSISSFLKSFGKAINLDVEDDNLDEETYRQLSYAKILQLKNLYKGIYNVMVTMNKNNALKKDVGLEVKYVKTNLKIFIDRVKELTDIEVTDLEALIVFSKYVDHKYDKYIEIFGEKKNEEPEKTISFVKLALGIFSIMDMNYSPQMSLFAFSELKKMALERVQKQKTDGKDK